MSIKIGVMAVKIAGIALAVAAFIALVFSWSARGQDIARLTEWQSSVVNVTTAATVEPDAKGKRKMLAPDQVTAAISALKRSNDSCQAVSEERDRMTADAVRRADNADAALAAFQVALKGEYSSAEKRIKALESVKAAPTPALQCQAIGADSKAAWEGWK